GKRWRDNNGLSGVVRGIFRSVGEAYNNAWPALKKKFTDNKGISSLWSDLRKRWADRKGISGVVRNFMTGAREAYNNAWPTLKKR
ncbi:hypothetical protein, partial [Streptomyces sp. CHA16]|uniref:hypothetical protein n=1 Tax=Streptomyces sp. CHA16 TaxID=2841667 RepID=UPI0020943BBA